MQAGKRVPDGDVFEGSGPTPEKALEGQIDPYDITVGEDYYYLAIPNTPGDNEAVMLKVNRGGLLIERQVHEKLTGKGK